MAPLLRKRFIAVVTLGYVILASCWIYLSEQLLSGIVDVAAIPVFSTASGLALVAVTAVLFFLALRGVPAADAVAPPDDWMTLRPLALPFLLVVVVIVIIAAMTYRNLSNSLKADRLSQLDSIAELKVAGIAHWLEERDADAQTASRIPALIPELERLGRNGGADSRRRLSGILRTYSGNHGFDAMHIIDGDGTSLAGTGPTHEGDVLRRAAAQVHRTQRGTLVDLHHDRAGNHAHLHLLKPIIDTRGGRRQAMGVLVADIQPESFLVPYVRAWPQASATSETLLVRRDGKDVLFLTELRQRQGSALTLRLPLTAMDVPAVRAVTEQAPLSGEGTDYRNARVLFSSRPVPGTSWFLVAKLDQDEALAELNKLAVATVLLSGLALWLAAALFGLSWQRIRLRQTRHSLAQEQALNLAQANYQTLFENMLDGFAHCRMIFADGEPVDYEFLMVNPAFENVTGLKNVVGRKISDIIPDYRRDNLESCEMFGLVASSGEPLRWEHYLAALDRHFAFSIYSPAKGEFILVVENITARKRAEAELRKLSLAVAQSPASIVITDARARIEYVNPAFCAISGYAAAEVMGRNPSVLQSGRTPRKTYDQLWAALTQGMVWRGEFINRRKDGRDYVEQAVISPVRQADGEVTHYLAVKEDVTERIQAAAKLRESEERLRLAQEAAGIGTYDQDLISDTIRWDDRMRELWGVGPDQALDSRTVIEGIHPEDRAACRATLIKAFDPAGDGKCYIEYRVIGRADGRERHVAATGKTFFEAGRAVRFIGTVRDISARKRMEREFHERRSAMESLAKQQIAAQTAAAIAHELNQPLVAISAYAEVALRALRGGNTRPDKLLRALEGSVEQAQRAGRTLHELLDFLHKGEASGEPLDINAVIHEAVAIAQADGIGEFHAILELEPDMPPVIGNRLQVQKVVVNLLHNGVEATRAASIAAAITIAARTVTADSQVLVTIRDNGPGLDAEAAQRVFEPFFTTKSEGIGLGLAISRALIEAHNGQLWADPEGGPGGAFHFTLPFAP